ncbi:MAG TPA: hypothetical protein VFD56_05530 [Chitinophagaceae bacterium]|nr:hypothetical protein [Chitinophagaceae bacterium]
MKRKIIYTLAFVCCLSLLSAAKQVGTDCTKKSQDKPGKPKKTAPAKACLPDRQVKKTASADLRPFHFYLLNI